MCNKRGLVLTSRWNLLHRDYLHIYDSKEYFEPAMPLAFLDPSDVTDLDAGDEARGPLLNFEVDYGKVFQIVRRLSIERLPGLLGR